MSVRRFVAPTAREAMRQVREVLGPDAMIVANRPVPDGVEILALDEAGLAAMDAVAQAPAVTPVVEPAVTPGTPGPSTPVTPVPAVALEAPAAARPPAASKTRAAPLGVSLYRELLAAGFSVALARALSERLPEGLDADGARRWVRHELVSKLPVLGEDTAWLAEGGVIALVGPTGVGKTTTTAKLAARCVLTYGPEQVAMLTTDGFRIGAHEQLRIYGRILGIPVHAVSAPEALQQTLDSLRNRHIVLVDTVGMSQRDQNVAEQAALLLQAGRPVRRLLVLNAASHGDTLDEVAHAYCQAGTPAGGLAGCIITKLDEANRLGAALDTAIRHRLPLHYVCHGQQVPEHLGLAHAAPLIDQALNLARQPTLYAPTEIDMAWAGAATQPEPAAALPTELPAELPVVVAPPATPAVVAVDMASQLPARALQAALAAQPGGAAPAGFDRVLTWLRDHPLVGLAHDAWRQAGEAQLVALDVEARRQRWQGVMPTTTDGSLWAVLHGTVRSPAAGRKADWQQAATSWLVNEQGRPAAALLHHLHTPHGILPSWAEAEAQPPAATWPALLDRVAAAQAAWPLAEAPVHVLDGAATGLLAALVEMALPWLVLAAAARRVTSDGRSTTLAALSARQAFRPVGLLTHEGRDVQRWVARAQVQCRVNEEAEPLAVQVLWVRWVDIVSGEVVSSWQGLGQGLSDAAWLAAPGWLEQLTAGRDLVPWWRAASTSLALRQGGTSADLGQQLYLAGQVAVAAWALASDRSEEAARWRQVAGCVRPGTPRGRQAVLDGLVRWFAMCDVAALAARG